MSALAFTECRRRVGSRGSRPTRAVVRLVRPQGPMPGSTLTSRSRPCPDARQRLLSGGISGGRSVQGRSSPQSVPLLVRPEDHLQHLRQTEIGRLHVGNLPRGKRGFDFTAVSAANQRPNPFWPDENQHRCLRCGDGCDFTPHGDLVFGLQAVECSRIEDQAETVANACAAQSGHVTPDKRDRPAQALAQASTAAWSLQPSTRMTERVRSRATMSIASSVASDRRGPGHRIGQGTS